MTLERAAFGFAGVWSSGAIYALVSGHPLTGLVMALTAATTVGAVWALRPVCDEIIEPDVELRWPGPLRMVCAVCGETWSAVDPVVDVWCDAAEVHWLSHGPLAARSMAAYRAAVTMHAELAADVDRRLEP